MLSVFFVSMCLAASRGQAASHGTLPGERGEGEEEGGQSLTVTELEVDEVHLVAVLLHLVTTLVQEFGFA